MNKKQVYKITRDKQFRAVLVKASEYKLCQECRKVAAVTKS